ncbi:MAG: competence/damage-inducible protein A [Chromatiales bacterium]
MPENATEITAGVLLIGNELLSGRTQDANLAFIGRRLEALGVRLAEAQIVPDREEEIVAAVLARRHTYVFTTGGIGPTHDDITTAAIARAFGRPLEVNAAAEAKLKRYYGGEELSAPRLKMATVPAGCQLIGNPISSAPGFRIENVFVLAGVPPIMRAMFDVLQHQLSGGAPILSRSVTGPIGESRLAEGLTAIQERYADLSIGSYPFAQQGRVAVNIVLRGTDAARLEQAAEEVAALMLGLGLARANILRR